MIEELWVYVLTSIATLAPWPYFWMSRKLSTLRMVLLLFLLDSTLTVEAAYYGNIVFIGLLHVITIPALLGLLYFDLIKQHTTSFTCFLCSKPIFSEEEMENVTRVIEGVRTEVSVHSKCILGKREKKAISSRIFRKGIPK